MSDWYEGYRKFSAGRSYRACRTGEELRGWLAAQRGEALCGVLDVRAEAGATPDELDGVLFSIENDHEWTRTGC